MSDRDIDIINKYHCHQFDDESDEEFNERQSCRMDSMSDSELASYVAALNSLRDEASW